MDKKLRTMAAAVCSQKTHVATTWRSYPMQAPPFAALQRSAPLLLRRSVHTSSSLRKRRRNPEDEELSQLLQNYREELRKTPRPAVYLTLASLVPVVVAPLTMSLGGYYYPEMAYLQFAAANCVLSFYGGIRWGISVPENSPLQPDSLNLGLGKALFFFAWTSLVLWDSLCESALMLVGGIILAACGGGRDALSLPVLAYFSENHVFPGDILLRSRHFVALSCLSRKIIEGAKFKIKLVAMTLMRSLYRRRTDAENTRYKRHRVTKGTF
ncbi:hypothetical protein GDO78_019473 [Eleutherodactylus coqui]|uniref:Transmembrane protein 69 n=1 Tax=Eleutherodactylus coqui TaxID=57060 RepID=A0A8J6C6H7_ELECQ|nr:hypothetical protein GDO78_019473 [Eleutherodactylus coqui]